MVALALPVGLCRVLLAGLVLVACDTAQRDTADRDTELQAQLETLPKSAEQPSTSVTSGIDVTNGGLQAASTPTIPISDRATFTSSPPSITSSGTSTTSLLVPKPTSSRTPRDANPTQPGVVAKSVQGPAHRGEGFIVYLQGTSPLSVGQTRTFTVVIEPQAPFKSNDKYPYRFGALKAEAATLGTDAVTVATVTPNRTTLQVNVTGASAGAGSLEGTLSFSVCTAEKCLVERTSLNVAFEVTPSN